MVCVEIDIFKELKETINIQFGGYCFLYFVMYLNFPSTCFYYHYFYHNIKVFPLENPRTKSTPTKYSQSQALETPKEFVSWNTFVHIGKNILSLQPK